MRLKRLIGVPYKRPCVLSTVYPLGLEQKEPQVCASEVTLLKKCGRSWIQWVVRADGGGCSGGGETGVKEPNRLVLCERWSDCRN